MFFFFKQKTAYEMRISDWSSDVCSSDLPRVIVETEHAATRRKLGELLIDRAERRARRDADQHAFVGPGAKCPVLGVGGLDLANAVEQVGMEVARDESGAEALARVRFGLASRTDGRARKSGGQGKRGSG